MELHLYASDTLAAAYEWDMIHGLREVDAAIAAGVSPVHTTQMCLLDTAGDMLDSGARIFLHDYLPDGRTEDVYELRLGSDERTGKDLRRAHNFYRLWRAGAFSPS